MAFRAFSPDFIVLKTTADKVINTAIFAAILGSRLGLAGACQLAVQMALLCCC